MESIDLISIATIAFLGSFGHCIGMCGGIVIAYSSAKIDKQWSKLMQGLAHLTYSFGRITTYVLLGAIFGAIGGVAQFNGYTTAALTIFAGVFMILAGLSLLGKLDFLAKLEHSFFSNKVVSGCFPACVTFKITLQFLYLRSTQRSPALRSSLLFAVTAASTGSPLWGALVMLIFGLSTIPALFSLGFFTQLLSQGSFRKVMMNLAAIIVILFGLYTIYRGSDFIENPEKSVLNCCEEDKEVKTSELAPFEALK